MPINRIFKYRDRIDLEPSFQREKVWSTDKQQHFLDTILKGWGVPKLYLQVIEGTHPEKISYKCIDGKQRLTAIFSFLEKRITLNKKYSGDLGGKRYEDLSDAIQNKFDDYILHIEEVTAANEKETSDLFKRLQLGSPLNSGEKLMAIVGDMRDFVKKLSSHHFFKNKVSLPNTRYTHFTVCAQVCYLEIFGIVDISLHRLETLFTSYGDFEKSGYELKMRLKKIKEVMSYLNRMFTQESPNLRNRASVVSTYLLISELMDKGNISGKEKKLKQFLTKFMQDLRKEIGKGVHAKDAQFINYQSAVIQGADNQKSIKLRRDILLKKLYDYDPFFYRVMHTQLSPEEKFGNLYDGAERHFGSTNNVDAWLLNEKPRIKMVNCGRGDETLPTHIRHCIHHKRHGKYTEQQLRRMTALLLKLLTESNINITK